jgi:FkbM family methyltransferase
MPPRVRGSGRTGSPARMGRSGEALGFGFSDRSETEPMTTDPRDDPPSDETVDFRASKTAKKQSWFGLKRHVKRFMSWRVPNAVLREVARLVPSLGQGRLPAPASVHEVTAHVDGISFVMLDPARCEVAKELYWGRGRMPRPQDAFALDTVTHLARDADALMDVGAYTGVFSLAGAAANPKLQIHAFEIVPQVAGALEANLRRNDMTRRVQVHVEGLGEEGKTMRVPTGEGGSALPSFYSSRMHFEDGVEIPFRSLDSLIGVLGGVQYVVMKIDVEGTEDELFRHGQRFLERFRPHMLCEVLYGVADPRVLEGLLSSHGYRFYAMRERAAVARDHIDPDPQFRDWLFSTSDPSELASAGIRTLAR